MHRSHRTGLVAVAALAVAACGGSESAAETTPRAGYAGTPHAEAIEGVDTPAATDPQTEITPEAAVDMRQAVRAARDQYPEGKAIEVEVGDLDDRPTLEVELVNGTQLVELYIDRATGEVIETQTDEVDMEDREVGPLRLALTPTSLADAVETAFRSYDPTTVREVELELHGDMLVMEVEVLVDGEEVEYVHDPVSGALIGPEDEELREQRDEDD